MRAAKLLSEESKGELYNNYPDDFQSTTQGVVFRNDREFFQAVARIMGTYSEKSRIHVAEALDGMQVDSLGKSFIYY